MPRTQYPRALCPRMARELKTLFKMLKSWGKPGEISQSAGEMRIEMNEISIKKVRQQAILPRRATPGSAGMDVCACINVPYVLQPGERVLIPTGFAMALPEGWAGFVFARSGLGTRKGIALSNGVGVIDSDYRGEVCVGLCNFSQESYTIAPGDRIAQLVVMPVWMGGVREVDSLEETARGENGFGSTGIR